MSGQLDAPVPLSSGKEPRYQLNKSLGVPQSRSGGGVEEEKSLSLLGIIPRSSNP
jgi:hypothetical protein